MYPLTKPSLSRGLPILTSRGPIAKQCVVLAQSDTTCFNILFFAHKGGTLRNFAKPRDPLS